MQKLIINRGDWDAGLSDGKLLHNEFDYGSSIQCCLGHYCSKVLDIDNEILIDVEVPSCLNNKIFSSNDPLLKKSPHKQKLGMSLMWEDIFAILNDYNKVPQEPDGVREQWIKEGFKQILNIDLEFIGEYKSFVGLFDK